MDCGRKTNTLIQACLSGRIDAVENILQQGANVNARDWWDRTPLMEACKAGNEDVVELLIRHGGDIDAQDECGRTALATAKRYKHYDIIRLLLQHGAKPDGVTLEWACHRGYEDVVESLLKHGVSRRDRIGALIISCNEGDEGIVALLLQNGVKFDISQGIGGVPQTIFSIFEKNSKILELLLQHDAIEVDAQDGRGNTALMLAYNLGRGNVIRALLRHGANVNARDEKGMTPLFSFCKSYKCNEKTLMQEGADVNANASNQDGEYPFMLSCDNGHPELIKILLQHGANIDDRCEMKRSAVMWAVASNRVDCVKTLVAAGANLELMDDKGCTVFSYAVENRNSECLEVLLVDGVLLTEGKLKPVHKNLSDEAKSMQSLLCTIEHGVFEWKWLPSFKRYRWENESRFNIEDAENLIRSAFKAGFCPGKFKYLDMTISPLILFFLENDTETIDIFLDYLYYLPEDMTTLSTNNAITARIKNKNTTLLQQTTCQPLSLETWSFLTVSKAICLAGPPGLRGPRVESLPIPDKLKRRLTFTLDNSDPRTHRWNDRLFSGIQSESESESEFDDDFYYGSDN